MPISEAAPALQQFWAALQLEEPPFPVLYYALGDAYRGQADQEQAKAEGKSNAGWTESPHNYQPARAIDIYPIIQLTGDRKLAATQRTTGKSGTWPRKCFWFRAVTSRASRTALTWSFQTGEATSQKKKPSAPTCWRFLADLARYSEV